MHMYMFVLTCSFLVGAFWAETILGPCSQKNGHAYAEKSNAFALFQKWLPRPNHYAHMKGIEILYKTPVRMSRNVPSESNSRGTNIVPQPECRPEILGGGDGGGVPRTLPIW